MQDFNDLIVKNNAMKNPDDFRNKKGSHAESPQGQSPAIRLQEQIRSYEREKNILLDLSNMITMVREKDDLITLFTSRIKGLFYYTHAVITLIDRQSKTYSPFLIDHVTSHISSHSEYSTLTASHFPLDDPFISQVITADEPLVFILAEVMDRPDCPSYLKINYEAGIREMLMIPLKSKNHAIGFLHLNSDKTDSFTNEFKSIIKGIAPLLSSAISNIIKNEEIGQKEWDKSFLLNFSNGIAAVRTKDDLSCVIYNSLKKLSLIKAYFIRTINEDGRTCSPFIYDKDAIYIVDLLFKELMNTKIIITEGITGRVMSGNAPLVIDFAEEVRRGTVDPYVDFWKKAGPKKAGFEKMVGTPLRVGDKELGALWVITNKINMPLLEGVCAQISIAVSNIMANEEITRRQEEKSKLLSLSDEIAAMRSRNDLLRVVNTRLKSLFAIDEFGISQVNEDHTTYSAFVLDLQDNIKGHGDFERVTTGKYSVTDRVFGSITHSQDPVLFDVASLAEEPGIPAYVGFWKSVGLRCVLGMALRVGGATIGCVFLHVDKNEKLKTHFHLLKAVCAQLAVAVSNILANEQLLHYKQMLEIENDHLKEQIKTIYNFSEIIGSGAEMQKVYRLMSLVAEASSTVLLLGETGTGKELIARAIHNASPRKDKLMVKVNCAALPANLIESELFGHERGAFTGAIDRRLGKFELANNSTLFLDEIGEMPLETQVKLLRVIQEREFERVGGKNPIKVNVRIIAATNRKLDEEVNAGRFRPDLYYRLNVFPISLPSLRDRPEDIEPLANFFVERYSKSTGRKVTAVSAKVIKELKGYSWPGNVRELEHLIERSILLTEGNVLKEIQLPVKNKIKTDDDAVSPKALQEIESSYIIEVLKRCKGRISGTGGAADILGIPATTLHSKMKKLGVSKADYFQNQQKAFAN
jgi:transcriptional regulator with GAF, ATPase, and Fis domain